MNGKSRYESNEFINSWLIHNKRIITVASLLQIMD